MPIYVYGCDTCGHQFEQMQRFQDQPLTSCPKCGAALRKIIQPAGIVFKGTGWYSTNSRAASQSSTKPAKAGKATGGDSSSGSSDGGGSSDGSSGGESSAPAEKPASGESSAPAEKPAAATPAKES